MVTLTYNPAWQERVNTYQRAYKRALKNKLMIKDLPHPDHFQETISLLNRLSYLERDLQTCMDQLKDRHMAQQKERKRDQLPAKRVKRDLGT